jgi:putative methylase|tara:strand:- start:175 stop:765 length:591 start_codon:yes stop_codon:yes gene_type:complete
MITKKQLAIKLSKFEKIEDPEERLEQYALDPEVAAELLWRAYLNGDVEGKVIADLGCGSGMLGGGGLLLGASKVYFVDKDKKSLEICKKNVKGAFVLGDVKEFNKKVDVVFENPPFGVKEKHADREFLGVAFKVSDVVYSIHKIESKDFIEKFSSDNGFIVDGVIEFDFVLGRSLEHHKKDKYVVKCGCWILRRKV